MDTQISNYEDYKEITEREQKKRFLDMAKKHDRYLKLSLLLGEFTESLAKVLEIVHTEGAIDQMKKITKGTEEVL
jgi:hypothetical protein